MDNPTKSDPAIPKEPSGPVTQLLAKVKTGDKGAVDDLFSICQERLRRDNKFLSRPMKGVTSLVNDLWLDLQDKKPNLKRKGAKPQAENWLRRNLKDKGAEPQPVLNSELFYRLARQRMRELWVDHWRAITAIKRGGERITELDPSSGNKGLKKRRGLVPHLNVYETDARSKSNTAELIVQQEDEAQDREMIDRLPKLIEELKKADPRAAEVLCVIFFDGATHDEAGARVGVTGRQVRRIMAKAMEYMAAKVVRSKSRLTKGNT